jgi:hypothetical protein
MNIKTAVLMKNKAHSYPRQGEGWPRPGLEQDAENILKSAGVNDLGRTAAEEKAVADFYQQQSVARADAAKSAADDRVARLAAAAAAAAGDIGKFVQSTEGLKVSMEEITEILGVSRIAVLAKKSRVGFDRRGHAYLI